jgi:hypothetical protein
LGALTIHEEVFEDKVAFAALERTAGTAAYDLAAAPPRRQRACIQRRNLGSSVL